tara:strand:+ start:1942 stop:2109 length:168 start_codon:yes stop_codon:yes gene_type:complete
MIEHHFDVIKKVLVHDNKEVCDCDWSTHYPKVKEAYPGKREDLKKLQEEIRGIPE